MGTFNVDKKYIPISNAKEMYNLGKALTDKNLFEFFPEEFEASMEENNMLVQITEYDIFTNPSLIMKATKKEEIREKVFERLNSLDQNTSDLFKVLFAHFVNEKRKKEMKVIPLESKDPWLAYISIDDIHFSYKGLKGKNKESHIAKTQYENYISSIDILTNTKVKFDITKETNAVYQKLKALKWGAVEGFLINNVRWAQNKKNTRVDGIWYDLGLIGEAFTKHIPNINEKYPKDLLKLNYKVYPTVKNIGNFLCWCHKSNNIKAKTTEIDFYDLLGEVRFEITKSSGIQKSLDRFMNNFNKAIDILKENNIISSIEIPEPIHTNNYKKAVIVINWIY